MKQFVKKALLPLAVFVVAVVSAFAMNSATTSTLQPPPALYNGPFCYVHPTTSVCTNAPGLIAANVNCTLDIRSALCTVFISGVGVVNLNICIEFPPSSGNWMCVQPLYDRSAPPIGLGLDC